jgi:hypothetical protein
MRPGNPRTRRNRNRLQPYKRRPRPKGATESQADQDCRRRDAQLGLLAQQGAGDSGEAGDYYGHVVGLFGGGGPLLGGVDEAFGEPLCGGVFVAESFFA